MRCRPAFIFGLLALPSLVSGAEQAALENILVSKEAGVTKIQLWPACEMEYLDHSPGDAGSELRIRVSVSAECNELLQEFESQTYRRSEFRLGNVTEISFDAVPGEGEFISLVFRQPQKFEVSQHTVGWIEVFVDTNIASASLPDSRPPPLHAEPTPTPSASLPPPVFVARDPSPKTEPRPERREVTSSDSGNYVIQLGVFSSVEQALAELSRTGASHFAYTTDFSINGTDWHGLQIGFFETEADANQVLNELQGTFPDSWVRYVDAGEADAARQFGGLRELRAGEVAAVAVSRSMPIDEGQLALMMADARNAAVESRLPTSHRSLLGSTFLLRSFVPRRGPGVSRNSF